VRGEPVGEGPDVRLGGRPAAEARGRVERDEVHVGPERAERRQELGQLLGQLGRVVHALDARVLERDAATVATGDGCNASSHTYTRIVTFPNTAPMQLRVNDVTHGDDSGALKVVIQRV